MGRSQRIAGACQRCPYHYPPCYDGYRHGQPQALCRKLLDARRLLSDVHAVQICLTPLSVDHLSPQHRPFRELRPKIFFGVAVYSIVWHLSRPRCAALYIVLRLSGGSAAPALERSKNGAVSGGDDEAQEDTLARRVRKKLLVECISAHGGHLPEDGLKTDWAKRWW